MLSDRGVCRGRGVRRGRVQTGCAVGLVFVCALLGTRTAAEQQLREEGEDDAGAFDTHPHFALRPSASADATEEFFNEIYTQRPSVLEALLDGLDEQELIASIEDPENIHAATSLCQLGNLYASEGLEEEAVKCFQASAESLDMGGMYNYANALLRGRGCEKDETAAIAWFREAAAMICDSSTFLRRHIPDRLYVSESGVEGKDQINLKYDNESHELIKVSDSSGRVLWDGARDSEEMLGHLFKGLDVEEHHLPGAEVEALPVPAPVRCGYKEAVIEMSGILQPKMFGGRMQCLTSEDMSAQIDFEQGIVRVKNEDGSARDLSNEETLAAILLQVSLNRCNDGNATAYTEELLKSKAWRGALDFMQRGVAKGDEDMCAVLGALYANGLGVETDYEKAHELFLEAAKKGVPEAMNNVALHLMRKDRDEQADAPGNTAGNTTKAVVKKTWYPVPLRVLRSVWYWIPSPLRLMISIVFRTGSMTEAEMWLQKAAQAGCAAAKYNIAVSLQNHAPVPVKSVASWLQQAAEMGHGPAMNNLALLYLEGTHPNGRDVILARKWLRKAAEEPSGVFLATDAYAKDQFDGAQFEEEECDRDLSQVPGKNPAKEALYNLGIVNELGLGAKPNLVSASRWYSLAMEKGLRDAGEPQYLY